MYVQLCIVLLGTIIWRHERHVDSYRCKMVIHLQDTNDCRSRVRTKINGIKNKRTSRDNILSQCGKLKVKSTIVKFTKKMDVLAATATVSHISRHDKNFGQIIIDDVLILNDFELEQEFK